MKLKERKAREEKAADLEKRILEKIRIGSFIGMEWITKSFREKDYSSVSSFLSELQEIGSDFDTEIVELNNLQHCTWT